MADTDYSWMFPEAEEFDLPHGHTGVLMDVEPTPGIVLPTIGEIRNATQSLGQPGGPITVVRIGNFIIKYSNERSELEGKNLRFVKEHFNIPVPDVYAAFTDLNDGMKYVVMEFIEGETLDAIWPGLSPAERANVINQIKSYLLELRKLPSHGYIGCIDGTRNWGPLFGFPRKSLKPFASEQEMGESVMQTIAGVRKITGEPARSESFLRIIRSTIMPTFQGHEIYFTHGDLQPRNIIVTRKSDVPNDLTVTIIDWESASWAPEYREYTIAMTTPEMKSMWTEVVAEAFQEYRVEYLTMQYVSRFGRVFY